MGRVGVGVTVGLRVRVAVGVSEGDGDAVWVKVAEGILVGVVVSVGVRVGVGGSVAVAVSVSVTVWLGVKLGVEEGVAGGLDWIVPQRSPPPYMIPARMAAMVSKSNAIVPRILSLALVNGGLDAPLYPITRRPTLDGSYEA